MLFDVYLLARRCVLSLPEILLRWVFLRDWYSTHAKKSWSHHLRIFLDHGHGLSPISQVVSYRYEPHLWDPFDDLRFNVQGFLPSLDIVLLDRRIVIEMSASGLLWHGVIVGLSVGLLCADLS